MDYESIRLRYKPKAVKYLLIAESPPPPPEVQSSRQFYYTERIRKDDRLFTNTIRAVFPETTKIPESELEKNKEYWLNKFKAAGFYMIEALELSQEHEVSKIKRQRLIRETLTNLIDRVRQIANKNTKIILIKSNVYEIAAEPLRQAGFNILNKELVDYPGRFNQKAYREKLSKLINSNNC